MTVSILNRFVATSSFIIILGIGASANASSTFTVTDLGTNYTLQQNTSGAVNSVTSGNGENTYVFSKSPVTPINVTANFNSDTETLTQTVVALQNGTHQAGYTNGLLHGMSATINVPTGMPFAGGVWQTYDGTSPISDLNSSGEIVGTSMFLFQPAGISQTNFAAFSLSNGQDHSIPSSSNGVLTASDFANDLNNYISSNLGVYLTASLKVDDLGQIIAEGTLNGKNQYFLLTPNGSPTPAPEPSTLALLGFGIVALGIRSAFQRRNRLHSTA